MKTFNLGVLLVTPGAMGFGAAVYAAEGYRWALMVVVLAFFLNMVAQIDNLAGRLGR